METNLDLQNRKKAEAASISSAIGAKQPGSPVSSPDDGIASGLASQPKTILINGIPHQNLPDQKFPGPLNMMANAAGETIKFAATAPFSNRTDDRLAANRRDLNTNEPTVAKQENVTPIARLTPGAQAALNQRPPDLTSRQAGHMIENNLGQFEDKGSGITRQLGANGIASITNVGTENITDRAKGIADDSASARRDFESSGSRTPQMQLDTMIRNRMISDLTNPEITDPAAKEAATKYLGIAGNLAENQVRLNTAQGIAQQTDGLRRAAELRDKLLTETDPAKRSAMQDAMLAAQGRDINQGRYSRLSGGEQVIDPLTGQKSKMPDQVFDSRTGKTVQPDRRELSNQDFDVIGKKIGLPAEALKTRYEELKTRGPITRLDQFDSVDVALSVADGTKPETIAATIKRLGGNPADYGL